MPRLLKAGFFFISTELQQEFPMSKPEQTTDAVDNRKQGRRGKPKGRVVDLNALLEVQALLGDEAWPVSTIISMWCAKVIPFPRR